MREFEGELALEQGETSKLKSLTDGKRAILKETRKVFDFPCKKQGDNGEQGHELGLTMLLAHS